MNLLRMNKYLLALGFVFGATANANAGLIDFRDSAWGSANGQQSYTVNGVTASAGPDGWPIYAKLSPGNDGMGISSNRILDESDEIDGPEYLTIDFGIATLVEEITISNLYEGFLDEFGYYTSDTSGSWTYFTATDPSTDLFTINLNDTIQELKFKAPSLFAWNNFSVQKIKTADVPEPGTLALLGLGLAGLGAARRTSRKQTTA